MRPDSDRATEDAGHERQHLVAGDRRARALHELEPARQEDDRAEEAERDEQRRDDRARDGSVAEQLERDDRLLGPRLDPHEHHAEDDAEEDQPADERIGPVAGLLVREADEERHDGAGEDGRAPIVDRLHGLGMAHGRQEPPQHEQREEAQGQVDEEDPVPADRVGEESAERRADDRGDGEHRAEQALVLAALARAEEVTDDRERDREDRAGAQALEAAEDDELPHLLGEAAEQRAEEEEADADHDHRPPPELVGELAVDRPAHGRGEQVDRDDPDVVLVARQIGHDLWQRRAHDRLVEGGEEQGEHDRDQDLDPCSMVDVNRGAVDRGL